MREIRNKQEQDLNINIDSLVLFVEKWIKLGNPFAVLEFGHVSSIATAESRKNPNFNLFFSLSNDTPLACQYCIDNQPLGNFGSIQNISNLKTWLKKCSTFGRRKYEEICILNHAH